MALDGGKSRTTCILFREDGELISMASAGPSGLMLSFDQAVREVRSAIFACLAKASTSIEEVDVLVLGLADLDTRRDWELAHRLVELLRLPPRLRVVVEHDAVTAYYAVTHGQPGVAVIAGTGSIALAVNERGERARAGGWGWLFDDEGSAFWIAREALAAASRAVDGRGEETRLVDAIMRALGIKDFIEVIDAVYKGPWGEPGRMASLAAVVDEVAEEGDEVARRILIQAGAELAELARVAAAKLGMEDSPMLVGGFGGVFKSRLVTESFEREVKLKLPHAIVRPPVTGRLALLGPAIIALREAGLSGDELEATISRLSSALRRGTAQRRRADGG